MAAEPTQTPGEPALFGAEQREAVEKLSANLARAALTLAREHVPDVPLVAIIHPENTPSIRVAERLGMRLDRIIPYEGIPSRLYMPE